MRIGKLLKAWMKHRDNLGVSAGGGMTPSFFLDVVLLHSKSLDELSRRNIKKCRIL
jgi:hypothetical protein